MTLDEQTKEQIQKIADAYGWTFEEAAKEYFCIRGIIHVGKGELDIERCKEV